MKQNADQGRTPRRPRASFVALGLALGGWLSGCGGEDTSTDITPQHFQVQRDLTAYSAVDVYDWDTTLTSARLEYHIHDFHSGDTTIRVYDADGTLLLMRALVTPDYTLYVGDHEFVAVAFTGTGKAGRWTVQLSYNNFTGDTTVIMD